MTISANKHVQPTVWQDALVLCLVLGLFFAFMLGNRPLSVPDEGRYVEIPREMVATGDYLTPRLNGVKYFEKPVLFYWLEAFSIKLFGLREFTLRLWPALFALAGCLGVYAAGRRLYGRTSGLIAAAVLATSVLYYGLSRAIVLDMPVSALLTLSLLAFLVGVHEPAGWKRRAYLWSFYVFAALAVLTKGLIGLVVPALVIGGWILVLGEWRVLKTLYLPSGIFLFLLVAAPWHILVGRANPEFFNFYFIHEHFLRYLTKIHSRYQPPWFFVPVVLVGMFPWTAFLVQALMFSAPSTWRERHEHRDALYLMLWAGLVFLFFSASDSKLPPYILPVLPPLSLLIGRYLAAAWDSGDLSGVRAGFGIYAVAALALAAAFLILPVAAPGLEIQRIGKYTLALAAVLALGAVSTVLLTKYRGLRWALPALAVGAVLFLITTNSAISRADTHSIKPLALQLKTRLHPQDGVAAYLTYYQDLPVYLERRITIVGWTGELEFGTTVEDTSAWMIINYPAFWKQWAGRSTMYLLAPRKTYDALVALGQKHLYLIGETGEDVLVTNKEDQP
jgi:4-amino-4-deoxy-L-arabinose transferase-like glycosyltransferase